MGGGGGGGGSAPEPPPNPPPKPKPEDPEVSERVEMLRKRRAKREGRKKTLLAGRSEAGREKNTRTLLGE